jgi:hypothetical protein
LRLPVPIAEVDEYDPSLIAIRIDPAAEGDFLTDVLRPNLTARMGAKQGASPNVKLETIGICALS